MGILNAAGRSTWQQPLYNYQDGDQRQHKSTATVERRQVTLPSSTSTPSSGESGLSSAVKRQIGLAVGIPLGVILLASLLLYWLYRKGKSKQRETEDEQYQQRNRRSSKGKTKNQTGSSSRSVEDSYKLRESLPSPSAAEPSALPPFIKKDSDVDRRRPPSSHSVLGDLKNKVSLTSLSHKVSSSFRWHLDDKAEASGGLNRNPSNASSRGGSKDRQLSQREVNYQNLHVAQERGDIPTRSVSPIPVHVLGPSIPRGVSPTATSVRGDPELQRPVTPGFSVVNELARHDAHLQLLEDRRMIAERYGQLLREQDARSRGPTSIPDPVAVGSSRTQSPVAGPVDRGRGHTRTPSRQNLAQQAYQNRYYQTMPVSSAAPTASHNLERSLSPEPFRSSQTQSRHAQQPSSGSSRPGASPSPRPDSRQGTEKPLPNLPPPGSSTTHSRGQSNPLYLQRDNTTPAHRRAMSNDQTSGGRSGTQGSVRAALNDLRNHGIELAPSPAGTSIRSPHGSVRGRGGSTGGSKPAW